MTSTFGSAYASLYDHLYAEKDYVRECDEVEEAFGRHGSAVRSVLDLGCGTGGHALVLAGRGYRVRGVDRSPEMVARARGKAAAAGLGAEFIEGDVRAAEAGGPFDAALLMFAVLGYQVTNADVRATFANARRHLRSGGLLVFDAWYGPGVLSDPPDSRRRIIDTPDGAVTREATAELDVRRHLCTVHYRLARAGEATPPVAETHAVRFFFPMELEAYLEAAGFQVLEMSEAGAPGRPPGDRAWNVQVVARAA